MVAQSSTAKQRHKLLSTCFKQHAHVHLLLKIVAVGNLWTSTNDRVHVRFYWTIIAPRHTAQARRQRALPRSRLLF
jgi:hypothetical protein